MLKLSLIWVSFPQHVKLAVFYSKDNNKEKAAKSLGTAINYGNWKLSR